MSAQDSRGGAATSLRDRRVGRTIDREIAPIWHDRFARLLIRNLPSNLPNADVTALDIHCGVGRTTAELLGRLGPSARVMAIEPDDILLELARSRMRPEWKNRVYLKAGNFDDVAAMSDDAYNLVVANLVLGETGDITSALGEMIRINRIGGRVLATLPLAGSWDEVEDIFAEVLRDAGLHAAVRRLQRLRELRPTGPHLAQVARSLGVVDDDCVIEQERFHMLFPSGREFLFAPVVEHGPLRLWKAVIGKDGTPQELFWRLKEAIDTYYTGHVLAVNVLAGLINIHVAKGTESPGPRLAARYWRHYPTLDALWGGLAAGYVRISEPAVPFSEGDFDFDLEIDDAGGTGRTGAQKTITTSVQIVTDDLADESDLPSDGPKAKSEPAVAAKPQAKPESSGPKHHPMPKPESSGPKHHPMPKPESSGPKPQPKPEPSGVKPLPKPEPSGPKSPAKPNRIDKTADDFDAAFAEYNAPDPTPHATKPEAKRVETKPVEPKPLESKPEAKPAESKPEAKPAESKPEAKPAESKPEAKPAESKPVEAKPLESKPLESNPEAKPLESKPEPTRRETPAFRLPTSESGKFRPPTQTEPNATPATSTTATPPPASSETSGTSPADLKFRPPTSDSGSGFRRPTSESSGTRPLGETSGFTRPPLGESSGTKPVDSSGFFRPPNRTADPVSTTGSFKVFAPPKPRDAIKEPGAPNTGRPRRPSQPLGMADVPRSMAADIDGDPATERAFDALMNDSSASHRPLRDEPKPEVRPTKSLMAELEAEAPKKDLDEPSLVLAAEPRPEPTAEAPDPDEPAATPTIIKDADRPTMAARMAALEASISPPRPEPDPADEEELDEVEDADELEEDAAPVAKGPPPPRPAKAPPPPPSGAFKPRPLMPILPPKKK